MAVNDNVVRTLIADYQNRYATSPPISRNELAFRAIKAFRNGAGDSADESLAAAEHYLFARYMVSNAVVSENQMNLMVLGYDGIKAIAQTNSTLERAMRHNPLRPTSRISVSSVMWGLQGVTDGEADRRQFNPNATVPNWNWDAMRFGGITDLIADFGSAVY